MMLPVWKTINLQLHPFFYIIVAYEFLNLPVKHPLKIMKWKVKLPAFCSLMPEASIVVSSILPIVHRREPIITSVLKVLYLSWHRVYITIINTLEEASTIISKHREFLHFWTNPPVFRCNFITPDINTQTAKVRSYYVKRMLIYFFFSLNMCFDNKFYLIIYVVEHKTNSHDLEYKVKQNKIRIWQK